MANYDELKRKQGEIADALAQLRTEALESIRIEVGRHNFTADEVFSNPEQLPESMAETRAPVAVGPNGERWYGRGRKPAWLLAQESCGVVAMAKGAASGDSVGIVVPRSPLAGEPRSAADRQDHQGEAFCIGRGL